MEIVRNRYLVPLLVIATLAVAIHSPGEMSVDSGRQLHEAAIGRSMTWNPPFMSAWLRMLGRGMVATALFIVINTLATYISLSAISAYSRRGRSLEVARVAVSIVLVLNPIFFYYVGIVWKDVLIASFVLAVVALMVVADNFSGYRRSLIYVLALGLASILPLIRQQGILIAPIFVGVASWRLSDYYQYQGKRRLILFAVAILSAVIFSMMVDAVVHRTIRGNDDRDFSSGVRTVMLYDIAGIVSEGRNHSANFPEFLTVALKDNLEKDYNPQRVDPLIGNKVVRSYIDKVPTDVLIKQWAKLIFKFPADYVRHRLGVMARLLGFSDLQKCVPIFAGKYVLPEDASASDGQVSFDARDSLLGHVELKLVDTPIFRNWFYVLLLIGASVLICFVTDKNLRLIGFACVSAGWIYLLSFVPTAIACDVRYLYPLAVLSTAAMLICINGFVGKEGTSHDE